MLEASELELAVGYIKSIIESYRCPICDRSSGGRLRYDCGHLACPDCAEVAPACQLCTPPRGSGALVHDKKLSQRVVHAGELLKSFQEAYNIDVLKSKRISDQQKAERSLFPECIQAPNTYYNKRKSFATPRKSKGKENISVLPGELISAAIIMDKSQNWVQSWLDQHDDDFKKYQPRKPFADLSVNSPKVNENTPGKKPASLKENVQTPSKSAMKRPFKSALSVTKSQSILDTFQKESDKTSFPGRAKWRKKEISKVQEKNKSKEYSVRTIKKSENNESGIELDDEAIVIEDSQDVIDKDKAAWLAVLEAEKFESTSNSRLEAVKDKRKPLIKYHEPVSKFSAKVLNWMNSDTNDLKTTVLKKPHRVPFYKKVPITESCRLCHNTQHTQGDTCDPTEDKNISIVVETSSIITTITVNKSKINTCQYDTFISQGIQTELCNEPSDIKQNNPKLIESEDMFSTKNNDLAIVNNESPDTVKEVPKIVTKHINIPNNNRNILVRDSESLNNIDTKMQDPKLNVKIQGHCETERNANEKVKSITVHDSSSDSEHELSGKFTVTADVHRSYDEGDIQGILREISVDEIRVPKAVKRGVTPNSTDSSDKENRDPNTKRRRRDGKKSRKKR